MLKRTAEKFVIPAEKFATVLECFRNGRGFSEFENREIGSAYPHSVGAPTDTSPGWRYRHSRHLSTTDIVVEVCEKLDEVRGRYVKRYWGFEPAKSAKRAAYIAKLEKIHGAGSIVEDWQGDGYGLCTITISKRRRYSWGEYLALTLAKNFQNR